MAELNQDSKGRSYLKIEYPRLNTVRQKEIELSRVIQHREYLEVDIVAYWSSMCGEASNKLGVRVVRSDVRNEEEELISEPFIIGNIDRAGFIDDLRDKAEKMIEEAKEDIRNKKIEEIAESEKNSNSTEGEEIETD